MAIIVFNILSGYPPFTATLSPAVVPPLVDIDYGINAFEDVPDIEDTYTITITDSEGCEIDIDNISITTSTSTSSSTTTTTTGEPTTTTTTTVAPICADCYGVLYNYYAGVDVRRIAPTGWRVPTLDDFNSLILEIYPSASVNLNYFGPGKNNVYTNNESAVWSTRRTGNITWNNNNDATNTTEFCAVGSGYRRYHGGFLAIDELCMLMSSTLANTSQWVVGLYVGGGSNSTPTTPNAYTPELLTTSERETSGMAIRLIKEDSTDPGSVTDYDGNVYPTVKIGNQVWMKQNLKVLHYNNGDIINNVTVDASWEGLATGGLCYYNNDVNNACLPTTTTSTSTIEPTTTTTSTTIAPCNLNYIINAITF